MEGLLVSSERIRDCFPFLPEGAMRRSRISFDNWGLLREVIS